MSEPVEAYLVANARYHDTDFARLELLKLLAEDERLRVKVAHDFSDTDAIADSTFMISYTCDVRPTDDQQSGVAEWVRGGGRWMALHGTNAALDFTPDGVKAPRIFPEWVDTLGSQFIAHPPIEPYPVRVVAPDHPLVSGIEEFETDDELYLCSYPDRDALTPLMVTNYSGDAGSFVDTDWSSDDEQLCVYLRPLGDGAVLYNTLGHCRGHYDMRPIIDYYPSVDRCSWEKPEYYELLRRGIRWCIGEL